MSTKTVVGIKWLVSVSWSRDDIVTPMCIGSYQQKYEYKVSWSLIDPDSTMN